MPVSSSDHELFTFGQFTLDIDRGTLLRSGVELKLRPKSYEVLRFLVAHPGRLIDKHELLDAVWGHVIVTDGSITQCLIDIRRALDDADQSIVRTIPRRGYIFEAAVDSQRGDASAHIGTIAAGVSSGSAKPRWVRAVVWALPLLALLAFGGWKLWPGQQPAPTTVVAHTGEQSIAVMPLVNVGGDPEQQFFADGLSENLIDVLSKLDGLNVIGRISSFQFRNSQDDSGAIGAKLGVAYLISGSVQRAGDTVRIHTELVSTTDGRTMWTGRYDRPYKDLFALQDEIAMAISNALHKKLFSTRDAQSQDDRPPGGSIDAYNAYLQGLQKFYQQDLDKAAEYQQTATRLDPGYAAAWAQLSVSWTSHGQYGASGDDAKDYFRKSRAAVNRALTLQPDLGLAHGALAHLLLAADFDWRNAVIEFRRGVQLAPDNGQNHGGLSRALAATGKLREAIEQRQHFISMEPLFAANYFLASDLLIAAGRLEEAEKSVHIGAELQPRPAPANQLISIAILRGDEKAALNIAGQQLQPQWRAFELALAAQAGPDRDAADTALAKIIDDLVWTEAHPYQIAQIHALRGDTDKTVQWLERAWALRDPELHHLLYDPILLHFRNTPRFVAFCTNIGLPSPKESEALSIDQIRAATHHKTAG